MERRCSAIGRSERSEPPNSERLAIGAAGCSRSVVVGRPRPRRGGNDRSPSGFLPAVRLLLGRPRGARPSPDFLFRGAPLEFLSRCSEALLGPLFAPFFREPDHGPWFGANPSFSDSIKPSIKSSSSSESSSSSKLIMPMPVESMSSSSESLSFPKSSSIE